MTIDLYCLPLGAPSRSVMLTAKALGIDLNLIHTNLLEGEQLKPEFIKMNPQHTVPTLDDHGFYLWESRAIITYLVEKYGKDDSLYPRDAKKRALVNQRLYFDLGTLYQRFADAYYPLMFTGVVIPEDKLKKLDEAFEFLNKFLSESEFAAGNKYTVADLCLVASVSSIAVCDYDISRYPNVEKWLRKCKQVIPGYEEVNGKGVEEFRKFYLTRVNK